MKTRILFFCISCLLWASCENSRQNYVIEGTLPSVKYDGEWIYLVPMENAPGRVDSVKITNASFSFSGQGEEMRVLRLRHLLRIYIQEVQMQVSQIENMIASGTQCLVIAAVDSGALTTVEADRKSVV